MNSIHSIIIIKKEDKYLNYFDERWGMYLFPNIKGNDIQEIKNKYKTKNVKLLFDKIHEKYSVSHNEIRTYHHYFYEVVSDEELDGKYFTLEELLNDSNVRQHNEDIINFIKDFYNK